MVYVATVADSLRKKGWEIVQWLREMGVSADFDLKKRNLKKQLEYADSKLIPYVVLIGQKEVEKGKVRLKDMTSHRELELGLKELLQKLATDNK